MDLTAQPLGASRRPSGPAVARVVVHHQVQPADGGHEGQQSIELLCHAPAVHAAGRAPDLGLEPRAVATLGGAHASAAAHRHVVQTVDEGAERADRQAHLDGRVL